MSRVGASANEWAASFDGSNIVWAPINIGLWMVMDRHLDIVFLAKLLDGVHGFGLWFGDQRVDAGLFGKLEAFAALGFFGR